MRSRTAILAAMLAMAPLGANGADLVVWWDEGYYAEEDEAVAEIIAAFEQKTGKNGRAGLLTLQGGTSVQLFRRFLGQASLLSARQAYPEQAATQEKDYQQAPRLAEQALFDARMAEARARGGAQQLHWEAGVNAAQPLVAPMILW